ncbi:hypothetical protein R1sor_024971 [Riccia sorocarpa]|uniref:Uncharacterized protein n=1 Tax=Riccia sorocarpa TaxID=122646 RepID=A0ABD3G7R9_9MARC
MVRDPGRAPSGQPPSQRGQPDRQERHRTHRTGASEVRTTPSTIGGGRPPTHRGGSSGGGSSEGGRPRVSSGAASGGSGQTSIPVSVPASRPSTFAPATAERGSGPSGEGPSRPTLGPLDVSQMFEAGADVTAFMRTQMQEWVERVLERGLEQFAAQYGLGHGTSPAPSGGGASTDRVDDIRRRRSRSSHEDDHDTRDRRRSQRSPDVDRERRPQSVPLVSLTSDRERRPQSVPLVSLQLDTYGHTEGDSMRVLAGMVREVCRLYLTDDTTWAEVPENQRLAIATRLAAKYGPVSVQYQNAERRVEIRREKNVMVTNPFRHQGFAGFRARFKKAFGVYPLPKHIAFARAHGIKRVFEFMENGRDIPESDEAAGEDGAVDDDFAAAAAAGAAATAAAETGDGVDDGALSDFSEGLGGAELEEDELGLSPQQEQHAEAGGDDEDDTESIFRKWECKELKSMKRSANGKKKDDGEMRQTWWRPLQGVSDERMLSILLRVDSGELSLDQMTLECARCKTLDVIMKSFCHLTGCKDWTEAQAKCGPYSTDERLYSFEKSFDLMLKDRSCSNSITKALYGVDEPEPEGGKCKRVLKAKSLVQMLLPEFLDHIDSARAYKEAK